MRTCSHLGRLLAGLALTVPLATAAIALASDPAPTPGEPADPTELLAAELAALEEARPVLDASCARCHTSTGTRASRNALRHFSMDTYPFGGHHADEVSATIRLVLGATGRRPTMPLDAPGTVQGEQLAKILAWADAYDRAEAAGAHDHGHMHLAR
jgi:mono/diheme cytochrome c family protein